MLMRSRRAALALFALVLTVAAVWFAIAIVGWGPNADRDSYVAKNVALLKRVPVFPGAELVRVTSAPYRLTEQPGARIAGYGTRRSADRDEMLATWVADRDYALKRECKAIRDALPPPSNAESSATEPGTPPHSFDAMAQTDYERKAREADR